MVSKSSKKVNFAQILLNGLERLEQDYFLKNDILLDLETLICVVFITNPTSNEAAAVSTSNRNFCRLTTTTFGTMVDKESYVQLDQIQGFIYSMSSITLSSFANLSEAFRMSMYLWVTPL